MKAFGINQYGNAQVIQEYELPKPKIGATEVLIKTNAFAINAFDIAVRNGRFRDSVILLFPIILGSDAVGRIEKIGRAINNYKVGDDVIARPGMGTYAEYFKVSTEHIGLLPNSYDSYQAAGLPLSGITAYNNISTCGSSSIWANNCYFRRLRWGWIFTNTNGKSVRSLCYRNRCLCYS